MKTLIKYFTIFFVISSCSNNGGGKGREDEGGDSKVPMVSVTISVTCVCVDENEQNAEDIIKQGDNPLEQAEAECNQKGKIIMRCGPT